MGCLSAQTRQAFQQVRYSTSVWDRRDQPSGDCDQPTILVVSRNQQAADSVKLGLRDAHTVFHTASIETAIVASRTWNIIAAFVDCDLPSTAFRMLATGIASPIRIIGIRNQQDARRPIELMAERLIAAYVKAPLSMAAVVALVNPRACRMTPVWEGRHEQAS